MIRALRGLRRGAARTAARDASDLPDVDVAIVCESTYPYLRGGLSAVVHQICRAHPDLRIGIVHIAWDRRSPSEPLYDMPPQVAWVMPLFQSLDEHAATFKALRVGDARLSRRGRRQVVARLFAALDAHFAGDDAPLWQLYDDGVNPLTRTFLLWPLLASFEFMTAAVSRFGDSGLSLTDLFWQLREFFSLAYAVTDVVFPRAAVYHAHTTGSAGLAAAAAARQQGTRFLLTEHNLYARDTVNTLLGRSLATPVTLDEWRTLDRYERAGLHPETVAVTPAKRPWMAWFSRLGVVAYRAADAVTYLYPAAIEEAAGLGAIVAKSRVLPNGVDPDEFAEARRVFDFRQARSGADRIWRFACAGRLVPIKGQLDLLEALARLLEDGTGDWELDVMGPEGEQPEYAALCRARAHELGLDGRVRFLGSVDLRERLGRYDALVLPSHNEGQPIVVLEAMAVGLPTIGTTVGGMAQLVEDRLVAAPERGGSLLGPCGLLVEAQDPAALAEAIATLMADPALHRRLSRSARARVDQRFQLRAAMAEYGALYRELTLGAEPLSPESAAAPTRIERRVA